jgi:type IV pilus assembly protein PilC
MGGTPLPTYTYTTQASAQPVHVAANNLPAAIRSLVKQNVGIMSIGEPQPDATGDAKVLETELCVFLRQLAASLENGTPMVEALRLLANESGSAATRRVLAAVATDIADGVPLSAALSARPRAFGPVVPALVRAGERSGDLVGTLRQLAEQREGFQSVARRARGVLAYPLLVAFLALGVVTFLLTFIVPKWLTLYKELGVEQLPAPTRVLQLLGRGLPWFLLALIVSFIVWLVIFLVYRRTTRGRLVLDYWSLGTPIVGRINLNLALARVCSMLGLLLRRGVALPEGLRLAAAASGNMVLAAALRRGERAVAEGWRLADGLRESRVLPESFVWRISVAESSGEVADALSRMGKFYQEISQESARTLQGTMEPILVVLLGFMVSFIVISIFLPLLGIVQALSG